ncbi:phage protein Gp37 [Pararoseomonas sp. SCSIO 73927]|uniref:phage protein Gp37 n=1 Tax=Pararoseomonas sp. SCSIO 73927 TaxID=3114537 RepID=UPI0030D17613
MIAELEDAIIDRLKARFRGTLQAIEHRPAKMTAEELARVLTTAPGAFVSFLGWRRRERPEGTATLTFGVYLVASNPASEVARRRGDARTIGAYSMIDVATRALEGFAPDAAAGAAEVTRCENLGGKAIDSAGFSVYGLAVEIPGELPTSDLPEDNEEAQVGEFRVFRTDWDVPPHGDVGPDLPAERADAADHITVRPSEEP